MIRMRSSHHVQLHPCSLNNSMSSRLLWQGAVSQAFLSIPSTGKRTVLRTSIYIGFLIFKGPQPSLCKPFDTRLPYSACIRPSELLWPVSFSTGWRQGPAGNTNISRLPWKSVADWTFSNVFLLPHADNCVYSSQSHKWENNLSCWYTKQNLQNTAHLTWVKQKSQTSHRCLPGHARKYFLTSESDLELPFCNLPYSTAVDASYLIYLRNTSRWSIFLWLSDHAMLQQEAALEQTLVCLLYIHTVMPPSTSFRIASARKDNREGRGSRMVSARHLTEVFCLAFFKSPGFK